MNDEDKILKELQRFMLERIKKGDAIDSVLWDGLNEAYYDGSDTGGTQINVPTTSHRKYLRIEYEDGTIYEAWYSEGERVRDRCVGSMRGEEE